VGGGIEAGIGRVEIARVGQEQALAAPVEADALIVRGAEPGLGIHEMGTARMGRDPRTSVLNGNNQLHDVPNVFVTDGACMTSASCVNPSLTYMALTARAADYAVEELKSGNI